MARLTEDKVRAIRKRTANGEQQKDLAQEYGVTKSAINRIVLRYNWRHVS